MPKRFSDCEGQSTPTKPTTLYGRGKDRLIAQESVDRGPIGSAGIVFIEA